MKTSWPHDKKFAFTIIDDTDKATKINIKPVYDFLHSKGIRTTKTVWAYPPKDNYTADSLLDEGYAAFIKDLYEKGFEIALHGAGSGSFTREEILEAFDMLQKLVGEYPKIQINHSNNEDCIYWGHKRFSLPVMMLYRLFKGSKVKSSGEEPDSNYFWGDYCKKHIKYVRNRIYSGINTIKYDPHMPYKEKRKEKYSNYWFSSSDGFDCKTFCKLISKDNIDNLSRQGGCCIVYTHFAYGFVGEDGELSEKFKKTINYLSMQDGWFVPAYEMLDYMLNYRGNPIYIGDAKAILMDLKWICERIYRRIILKV